jgi:hypothetical protein
MNMLCRGKAIIMITTIGLSIAAADDAVEVFEGWHMQIDGQGMVTCMVIDNPRTPMAFERRLIVNLASDQTVTGGRLFSADGTQRGMKMQEARTYWVLCDGPHALWDYYEQEDRLLTLSGGEQIPGGWAGRKVRFVSKTNAEVYGVLVPLTRPDQVGIKIEGACCGPVVFAAAGMSKLQTMKF